MSRSLADRWPVECQVANCTSKLGVIFQAWRMAPSLYYAVFQIDIRDDPDEWKGVCPVHYRKLQRSDGISLGYKTINGQLRAYIKSVDF